MSVKTVSDTDTGDSTHVGGADWNKVARYFNGTSSVINANINSDTTFQNNRMKFVNGSFVSTVSTSNITSTNTMSWPQPQGQTSDRLLSVFSNDSVFNKTMASWDNNIAGVIKFPSIRKVGTIAAGPVTGGGSGEGLLFGFVDMPVIPSVRGWDATYGSYWRYNTTTASNTPTGTRVPARWILKEYLPYYRCKFRLSTATNTRFYFGLSFETSIPATDTPMDNPEAGVLVGWRSTDTNVVIISNAGPSGGTGTSPSVTQTTVTKSSMSNQVRQLEVNFTSASSCTIRIMDGNATQVLGTNTITSNLPQDAMCPSLVLSNTSTTSVDMDIFFEELDHK